MSEHSHEHTHTHSHPHDGSQDHDHGHSQEHAKEYKNWVDKMNAVGKTEVSKAIEEAIALIGQADEHLMEAKKALIK